MKALILCLGPFCLRQPERANACLAAMAGTHTTPDMAKGSARCAACSRAGACGDGKEPSSRQASALCGQRLTAYHHGLFTEGKEHGSCTCRVSRRGLWGISHRSGRHGSMRLAHVSGDHLCAAEISRAELAL